jgi:hypothetical protein
LGSLHWSKTAFKYKTSVCVCVQYSFPTRNTNEWQALLNIKTKFSLSQKRKISLSAKWLSSYQDWLCSSDLFYLPSVTRSSMIRIFIRSHLLYLLCCIDSLNIMPFTKPTLPKVSHDFTYFVYARLPEDSSHLTSFIYMLHEDLLYLESFIYAMLPEDSSHLTSFI